jgi:hypothetical protein
MREECIGLTEAGGFTLCKWNLNDLSVQSFPDSLKNINLLDDDSDMKILGVQWDAIKNEIKYKIVNNFENKITKRIILSTIACLYYPIGLIDPVIVMAKIIMQKLWQSQVRWNKSVPQNIHTA